MGVRKTTILVTKHQRNELRKLEDADYWERLSDITEHPVEYLQGLERPLYLELSSQEASGTVMEGE